MDIRKVREQLGRVKIYHLKGDATRALGAAILALKELGAAQAPTDVRGALRESLQMLAREEKIKALLKAPLTYQPGQEQALLALLAPVYKHLQAEAGLEDHSTALARKKQIDLGLLMGRKLLAQGKVSEADAAFQTAVAAYRDEHRLFQLIGKSLLDANQPRRAFPYLKKAVEVEPHDLSAKELLAAAAKARETETPA